MRPERSLRYLLFSLSLLSASAFAQSVMIVDGSCQVQLSTSTVNPAARVDPLSGNLLVTSENGINCSGASVSLSAPASAVLTGSTFDISWSSTGASSCRMAGTSAGFTDMADDFHSSSLRSKYRREIEIERNGDLSPSRSFSNTATLRWLNSRLKIGWLMVFVSTLMCFGQALYILAHALHESFMRSNAGCAIRF